MALAGCLAQPGGGRDSRIGILEVTLVDCLALAAGGRTIGVVAWDVSLADCLAVAGPGGGIGAGRALLKLAPFFFFLVDLPLLLKPLPLLMSLWTSALCLPRLSYLPEI